MDLVYKDIYITQKLEERIFDALIIKLINISGDGYATCFHLTTTNCIHVLKYYTSPDKYAKLL